MHTEMTAPDTSKRARIPVFSWPRRTPGSRGGPSRPRRAPVDMRVAVMEMGKTKTETEVPSTREYRGSWGRNGGGAVANVIRYE